MISATYMTKAIAEQSNAINIFWLKKMGYLKKEHSWMSGGIVWTCGDRKNSIRFNVERKKWGQADEETYFQLIYTNTAWRDGEKSEMDYKIRLTTTACYYGGKRYWFICPLFKNGNYCGRRVGVLYKVGKYFGCRYCADIAYAAQMEGGEFRGSSVSVPDIESMEQKVKRRFYRGKPTRKFQRLIKMEMALRAELMRFGAKYF